MRRGPEAGAAESVPPLERAETLPSRALSLLALLAPFLLLQWLVPCAPLGGGLVIGMDYPRVSPPQQQELLLSLLHRSFPLFVPGFAGGQSAGALTAGQLYHPITYLAALLPGYWEGHALERMTLLRLLSLGLVTLLLYRLLRRLLAGELVPFLLASATVFNLRMLNLFHGAAALEAFTGHLLTAVALAWCWLRPGRFWPRAGVAGGTYLTITSGHPQFAYYALLATLLAALLIPGWLSPADAPATRAARGRYWARMAGLVALGGALAAPYALQFQLEFLGSSMRIGRSYEFSLRWGDTPAGAFANFFRPLQTATAGAFGGSALVLLAALAPGLRLAGLRPPRWVLGAWLALTVVFLCSLGDATPVHYLFWRFVPLFDSVRGPGRLTVLAPLLSLPILTWAFRAEGPPRGRLSPLALLAIAALLATGSYWALPEAWTTGSRNNTPAVFNGLSSATERVHAAWGVFALAALAAFGELRRRRSRAGGLAALAVLAAVSMQTRIALRHGTWTEARRPTQTLAEMRADKRERLAFRGDPGAGLYSAAIAERLEHSCLDPFLARLYTKHASAAGADAAYALLDAGRPADVLVVETGEPSDTATPYSGRERVALARATFNLVRFDVLASAPSWLELTFPSSPQWRASVDGAPVPIARANGAYQAVRVPAGPSTVEFRYVSRATELGVLIAALGFVAGAAWLSAGRLRGAARAGVVAAAALAAAGSAAAWRASLYTGRDLGTRYEWTPPAPAGRANLAFQRPTRMSPIYPSTWSEDQALGRTPDPWGSGTAVDGVRGGERGIRTTVEQDPHWIVELAGAPLVAEVLVHGGRRGPEAGARLAVELWSEGAWARVTESEGVDPVLQRFAFEPRPASRVRLQALGTRALAATEVEVYGPEP